MIDWPPADIRQHGAHHLTTVEGQDRQQIQQAPTDVDQDEHIEPFGSGEGRAAPLDRQRHQPQHQSCRRTGQRHHDVLAVAERRLTDARQPR